MKKMMKTLTIRNVGPIKDAAVQFGDLTVFVGPQATGKSIFLQWLKLVLDVEPIKKQLADYGTDWERKPDLFLETYFGEGMRSIWSADTSQITVDKKDFDLTARLRRRPKTKITPESVFLAPAQRVLTLRDGWPRPFGDYKPGDPYVVRAYSEKIRNLMENAGGSTALFPRDKRLKAEYRSMLNASIFSGFSLNVERVNAQKRLILKEGEKRLPYMVWSAGQREFIPLLLGLYWLMPSTKSTKLKDYDWVILEELEMGLHPRAVSTMLMLVLELLHRGYRVCLSSHSPQVLELVWAWQNLMMNKAEPRMLARILNAKMTGGVRSVVDDAMKKELRVYYFDHNAPVAEISGLDTDSPTEMEASWGDMLSFSDRANRAVAESASENSGHDSSSLDEEDDAE
ncbi:MAG TPA: AAA family ATPase [Terracidiphilus sp.]|jgi:hypothetical protein